MDFNVGNVGTVHWTAPEVLNCARYRFSADIYSFGMVLYELVTGNIPFGSLPPAVVIVSVLMKREQPKLIEPTHPMLVELIRGWAERERERGRERDLILADVSPTKMH